MLGLSVSEEPSKYMHRMNPDETGNDHKRQVAHYINYYKNRLHQEIKSKPNTLHSRESIFLVLA
jgi:hypothetical protein